VADEHDIRFAYTPSGRVAGRMQGDVHVDFRYDSEDRLVGVRNELGDEYRLELDANGRIIAEIGFDGSRRLYTRDVVGRVLKLVRASGSVTEYEHDELGRILLASHSDGTTEKYRYGGAGALLAVTNSTGTLELERDPVGRVIVERQGRHWVESRLDALGTRVHMTSSLGARQTVSRTQMGNVDRVRYSHSDEAVGVEGEIAFAYDALGLEMERRLPGSVISRIERDALGRPTRLRVQRDRTTMIDHRYEWDASAQLRRLLDGDTGATTYQHDALGQLAAAHYDDGEVELRLPDVVGNLFRSRDRKDSVYGPGGQVLSVTGRNGTTYYQYDADGRLSKKQGAEGSWTYRWNVTGLLSEVSRPDGSTVSFEYDGLGRRIRKRVGQRETRWVWDGNNPLHEWTSANNARTGSRRPDHLDFPT
jgi:YD repeat-containing protein